MPHSRPRADIAIRPGTRDDVSLMARWAEAMALESEQRQLDADTVRRGIAAAVDDPVRGHYFIADIDGEPVGTLMITREWSDWRNGWWWWIQSVYVRPEKRRLGVYRALYAHVLAEARANMDSVCGLRLYVERENVQALRTYEFLGMADTGYRMYEMDTRKD